MADFTNTPPNWSAEGVEPSSEMKSKGFTAGYKPPATYFNWFWTKVSKCISEIQTRVANNDNAEVGKKLDGETVQPTYGTNKTAGTGAEIFNDCRKRTYHDGVVTAGNVASGDYSHAEGSNTTASGDNSHSEGMFTIASAPYSHAEGLSTKASEIYSHAEGHFSESSGESSHAEGYSTESSGTYSHAEGDSTIARGNCSHAEGDSTTASGNNSHSEGFNTTSCGESDHAEGYSSTKATSCVSNLTESTDNNTIINAWDDLSENGRFSLAKGKSHCEGHSCLAIGNTSHAEGWETTASGNRSHSEGRSTIAKGNNSHAEGFRTLAFGAASHAGGSNTIANDCQTAIGRYNKSSAGPTGDSDTSGDLFIIGQGNSTERGNALRTTTAGKTFGLQTFGASGADYAEYFEWIDGNPNDEDRRGYFVTLDGEKIRKANADDDYILGVISATPVILGDVQSEQWHDMYKKDIFGERLTETVEVEETVQGGGTIPAHTETRWILNPDYDQEKEYVGREKRKEWAAVGLLGKLIVVDDGSCQVNGYCKVSEHGTATASDTGYRVIKRLDESHVKVIFK